MVRWNYKSAIQFYEIPENTNGKMSLKVYRDEILEKMVKPLLDQGDKQWVLKENGDSGHGSGRGENLVRVWKRNHGLQYYFNVPRNPDLAIIENCWQSVKQHFSKTPHWDNDELKDHIQYAWEHKVPQEWINKLVLSMTDRLHAVLDGDGRMTG